MGNKESTIPPEYNSQFQVLKYDRNNHQMHLRQKSTGQQLIGSTIIVNSRSEQDKIESLVEIKRSYPSPFVEPIQRMQKFKRESFFSEEISYVILFRKPERTLADQIKQRSVHRIPFSDEELKAILENSARGLEYLQKHETSHGNINAAQIIVNQGREVKISDPWMVMKADQMKMAYATEYPSPEKVRMLQETFIRYNLHSADLFSLGMVVLEASNLGSLAHTYKSPSAMINPSTINQLISNIQDPKLRAELEVLTSFDPKRRTQIYKFIKTKITNQQGDIEKHFGKFRKSIIGSLQQENNKLIHQKGPTTNHNTRGSVLSNITTPNYVPIGNVHQRQFRKETNQSKYNTINGRQPYINQGSYQIQGYLPTNPNKIHFTPNQATNPIIQDTQRSAINLFANGNTLTQRIAQAIKPQNKNTMYHQQPKQTQIITNSKFPDGQLRNRNQNIQFSKPIIKLQHNFLRQSVHQNSYLTESETFKKYNKIQPPPASLIKLNESRFPITQTLPESGKVRINLIGKDLNQTKIYNRSVSESKIVKHQQATLEKNIFNGIQTNRSWMKDDKKQHLPTGSLFLTRFWNNGAQNQKKLTHSLQRVKQNGNNNLMFLPPKFQIEVSKQKTQNLTQIPNNIGKGLFTSQEFIRQMKSPLGTSLLKNFNGFSTTFKEDSGSFVQVATTPILNLSNFASVNKAKSNLNSLNTSMKKQENRNPDINLNISSNISSEPCLNSNQKIEGEQRKQILIQVIDEDLYQPREQKPEQKLAQNQVNDKQNQTNEKQNRYKQDKENQIQLKQTTSELVRQKQTQQQPIISRNQFQSKFQETLIQINKIQESINKRLNQTARNNNTEAQSKEVSKQNNQQLPSLIKPINSLLSESGKSTIKTQQQAEIQSSISNLGDRAKKLNQIQPIPKETINSSTRQTGKSYNNRVTQELQQLELKPLEEIIEESSARDSNSDIENNYLELGSPKATTEKEKNSRNPVCPPSQSLELSLTPKRHGSTHREESEQEEQEYVIEEYEVGSRYEGQKRNNMRNGWGKFYYQEGSLYDGEWKDNKMHGYGKLYYANGQLAYQGDWYQDEFHGQGKVYNDNPAILDQPFDYINFNTLEEQWVFYQGGLVSDVKQGLGKIKLQNDQIFMGNFYNDKLNGEGRFYCTDGTVVHGIWEDSILVQKIQ